MRLWWCACARSCSCGTVIVLVFVRNRARVKPCSYEAALIRSFVRPRLCWSEAVFVQNRGCVLVEVVFRDSIALYSPATQYFFVAELRGPSRRRANTRVKGKAPGSSPSKQQWLLLTSDSPPLMLIRGAVMRIMPSVVAPTVPLTRPPDGGSSSSLYVRHPRHEVGASEIVCGVV